MKTCIAFFVILLFVYIEQTHAVRFRRVWDRSNSDNGRKEPIEEPGYHPTLTEVFGLENKNGTDYRFTGREIEQEGEDPHFDPTVVIVDKTGSPSLPPVSETVWPGKGLLDELFGRIPGFGIEERTKPWWKGEHICVDRKEIVEGIPGNNSFVFNFVHTSCEERDSIYICTKRVRSNEENKSYIEKRQCCYGYKLIENKCEAVELQGLIPTMESLGATRFVKMLTSVDLDEKLKTDNITVFCPSNDAVFDFEEDEEMNKIPQGRVVRDVSLAKVASGHLVNGYLRSGDLSNNQILLSTNDETKIRLNIYSGFSGKVITANCARVTKADNYATNGVVHLMESILPMPSKTVADIVSSDPQLSILKGLLSQANLVQTLRDENGNFTLLAPTDAAFKNLDELLLKKLQNGKGCVSSVIKNHMIPYVVCTSAITVAAQVRNLIDEKLIVKRNDDNKLFVNKAQVISHDILGTNGVVHIIDAVLMPQEAQTVTQALQSEPAELNDLIDLIEKAGMKEDIDSMKNFTLFVPKPSAIKEIIEDESQKDASRLRNKIKYHISPQKVKSCEFHNNQLLPTEIEGATLRINKYEIFPGIVSRVTVQCAPIISDNNDVCEGTIHYIDKVLLPTTSNVFQTLEGMENVSKFVHLLNESGLAETLNEEGPFTVLAPTNEAFTKMQNKQLLEDKKKLKDLLRMHILPEMFCCTGVAHGGGGLFFRQYVRTLEGSNFSVRRAHQGVRFSSARTLECDHVATNGVIHTLNKVIEPRRHRPLFVSLSDFFDI